MLMRLRGAGPRRRVGRGLDPRPVAQSACRRTTPWTVLVLLATARSHRRLGLRTTRARSIGTVLTTPAGAAAFEPCQKAGTGAADVAEGLSVVIPCHNAGEWLDSTLQSCWSTGVRRQHVVLVDDGSSDGAVERALVQWPELRVIRHRTAQGVAVSREAGLREANTRWLLFLDQDDYLLPEGLREVLAIADRADAPLAVVGDFLSDTSGHLTANRLWFRRSGQWAEPRLDLLYENVQIGRWLLPTAIAQRCSFRSDIGVADDLAFVSDVAGHCPVLAVSAQVLGYRVHPKQTSAQSAHRLRADQRSAVRRHLLDRARASHPPLRVALRRLSSGCFHSASGCESALRRAALLLASCLIDPTAVRSPFAGRVLLRATARALCGRDRRALSH